MGLTKISTGGVKDDAASQAKIADEAIDEARLQISNAGTNGQFLSKQSGNTGGLTWSDVTIPDADKCIEGNTSVEAVDTGSDGHVKITTEGTERVRVIADGKAGFGTIPTNYQIEVPSGGKVGFHNGANNYGHFDPYTSSGNMEFDINWGGGSGESIIFKTRNTERFRFDDNGGLGIAGANYGSSGQVLTSGGSGAAPSWANPAAGGNTVELVADGAIAAGKPVIIKSNGKAEQVQETIIPANPPACPDPSGTRLYFGGDIKSNISSDYAANVTGFTATGLTFNCWRENDNHIRGRFTKYVNDNTHDSGFSTKTITSSGNAYGNPLCRYVGDGYWLIVWATGNSSSNPVKCRTIRYNGDLGVENNLMSQGNASGRYFDAVRISDTRTVVTWRQNGNGSIYAHDSSAARVIDWSNSGTSRTFSGGSDAATGVGNHSAGQDPSLAYDSTNSKIVLVCGSAGSSIKIVAGTVSGSAGSGSISWGTVLTFANGSDFGDNATVTYDSTNEKLAAIYRRNSDGKIAGAVITIASDNTVTAYTKAFNTVTQTTDGNSTAVSSRGLFVRAFISNLSAIIAGGTISGTTFTWQGNQRSMSNNDSASPQVNYISAKDRFEMFREKTTGEELYGSQATASTSSNNVTSKNVIGFAPLAISDGNTGTINLDGNTVDNQSSLTAGTSYWVQNNGTLGTSVATTLAGGIALSSTKLLIKQYAVA